MNKRRRYKAKRRRRIRNEERWMHSLGLSHYSRWMFRRMSNVFDVPIRILLARMPTPHPNINIRMEIV